MFPDALDADCEQVRFIANKFLDAFLAAASSRSTFTAGCEDKGVSAAS